MRWSVRCLACVVAFVVGSSWAGVQNGELPLAVLVADANSGAFLQGSHENEPRPAGALHHWMILLAAQEQEALGTLPLDVPVAVSRETVAAWSRNRTEVLRLDPTRTYLLSDLLKAVVLAGSDLAAVVAAEAMWGSKETAVEALNQRGERLGLRVTRFASLHADDPNNITTAQEAALVALRLAREPSLLRHWGALRAIPFDDGRRVLANRNWLPETRFAWGYLDRVHVGPKQVARLAAVCAERGDLQLLAVSVGTAPTKVVLSLLEQALAGVGQEYEQVRLVRADEALQVRIEVEGGKQKTVVPVAGQDFSLPVRRGTTTEGLQIRYQLPSAVTAPVIRGEVLGEVIIEQEDRVLAVIPALSPVTIEGQGLQAARGPTFSLP